jgi:hypothetical protein
MGRAGHAGQTAPDQPCQRLQGGRILEHPRSTSRRTSLTLLDRQKLLHDVVKDFPREEFDYGGLSSKRTPAGGESLSNAQRSGQQ